MLIRQRQVVEVQFRLPPDGDLLNHPCIVLSNDDINEVEQGFVAVMLTSEEGYRDDLYTFELQSEMFTKPMKKKFSGARMHLIGNFLFSDVIVNAHSGNEMRHEPFRRLVKHISRIVFSLRD